MSEVLRKCVLWKHGNSHVKDHSLRSMIKWQSLLPGVRLSEIVKPLFGRV